MKQSLPMVGCLALTALATLPWSVSSAGTASFRIEEKTSVLLKIDPLTAIPTPNRKPVELLIAPGGRADASIEFDWPTAGSPCTIKLFARDLDPKRRDSRDLEIRAELRLPDGSIQRSKRPLTVLEAGTHLFEAYRNGDAVLTLGIQAELITDHTYRVRPTATRPVVMLVEIQKVNSGVVIPLEKNRMSTFLGESVTYSFQLGEAFHGDALRIELTPVEIAGAVLTYEWSLSGSLPGDGSPRLESRSSRVLSSAGVTSEIKVEHGDPPSGYRFLVTPRF